MSNNIVGLKSVALITPSKYSLGDGNVKVCTCRRRAAEAGRSLLMASTDVAIPNMSTSGS